MSPLDMSERGDLAHSVTSLGIRDARTVDKLVHMVEQMVTEHSARAWDGGLRSGQDVEVYGDSPANPYREIR